MRKVLSESYYQNKGSPLITIGNTILQWLKVRCKFPSLHFLPLTALLIANWLLRHFSQIYFTFAAEQFLFLHLGSLSSLFLSNVCAMVFYLPENYSSPCSICFWWPVHTPLAFMAQQFGSAQLAKHTHPFLFVFQNPPPFLSSYTLDLS